MILSVIGLDAQSTVGEEPATREETLGYARFAHQPATRGRDTGRDVCDIISIAFHHFHCLPATREETLGYARFAYQPATRGRDTG